MYVCCPNGPFGYCQTVSPSGALTTANGLPIFASTSLIEAPGGTDGVIIAAHPASANAANDAPKRSGTPITTLLCKTAAFESAARATASAPVDRIEKLVLLVADRLDAAARGVEIDAIDARLSDRRLIAVEPHFLVEVPVGTDLAGPAEHQPNLVLGHPGLDLGEVFERQRLGEVLHPLIAAERDHVRKLPVRALRVLPDGVAVGRLDAFHGLAHPRLHVAHRGAGWDHGGATGERERGERCSNQTERNIHCKTPARPAASAGDSDRPHELRILHVARRSHATRARVEVDIEDAIPVDRDQVAVRPDLLVEVAVGDHLHGWIAEHDPDLVFGHPRPDLAEILPDEDLREALYPVVGAERDHVGLLPVRALVVLPDGVAAGGGDDRSRLAELRLDLRPGGPRRDRGREPRAPREGERRDPREARLEGSTHRSMLQPMKNSHRYSVIPSSAAWQA